MKAVLPSRGIDRQERLVRSAFQLPRDHAPYLAELRHQVLLIVQAPSGIDDRHIDLALECLLRSSQTRPDPGSEPGCSGHDLSSLRAAPSLPAARWQRL